MRSIIKAAIRIVIIVIAIDSLARFVNFAGSTIYYSRTSPEVFPALSWLLPAIAIILAAIFFLLWRYSDWLVKKIAGNLDENTLVITGTGMDLINLAMRILGIVLVVTTIPDLVGIASAAIVNQNYYSGIPPETQIIYPKTWITAAMRLLLGAWLIFGADGIIRTIKVIWGRENKE